RLGLYPDAPKLPAVLGYEVSGTVERLGPGVTGFELGDSVLALTRFGGHADRAVANASTTFRLPPGMSLEEAAALPVNYFTAFHMVNRVGALRSGEKVLIHAAAGGVGLAAIQLCRQVEGVEIFGTASAAKHPFLRAAGVDHPIDYRTQSYVNEVRRLTDGKGLHLVLDPLGGKDWDRGYHLLRPAGRMVVYGFSNLVNGTKRSLPHVLGQLLSMRRFAPIALMNDNRGVHGVNLGHLWGEEEMLREEAEALLALYARGAIKPRVDRVFPLSRAAEAHRYVQERKNVGKVLFDCSA
ncbi:MAG TPA: zinc-binding dehydrogenase, partial [Myxococcaceae bacterium]|nr:zinc-binding dehydrogenase [Myxococcaceae bacterium]